MIRLTGDQVRRQTWNRRKGRSFGGRSQNAPGASHIAPILLVHHPSMLFTPLCICITSNGSPVRPSGMSFICVIHNGLGWTDIWRFFPCVCVNSTELWIVWLGGRWCWCQETLKKTRWCEHTITVWCRVSGFSNAFATSVTKKQYSVFSSSVSYSCSNIWWNLL